MGGRHKLTHTPPPYRRSAIGLLAAATALFVWAGTSLAAGQDAVRSAPEQRVRVYEPVPGAPLNRGALDAPPPPNFYIEPPLDQPGKPARVGPGDIEAPEATVGAESIEVPALGIDQDLIELAVIGNDLQVPDDYSDVGWWRDGPAPGEKGASVMVGHVDSPTGPAVFYQLSAMKKGNRINVALEDGSRTVFEVQDVQVYDRAEFPSSRVYRREGEPGLNLLTCGGSFDTESGLYSSNVVVYAELVEPKPAKSKRPQQEADRRKAGDQPKTSDRPKADERPARPAGRPKQSERPVDDRRQGVRESDVAMNPESREGVLL